MDADLDTLATALYVTIDDLLKRSPQLAPWRPPGQVFRFTALSWRRFYPSSRPITILYCDLIASLLGRLRHVRNWNADIISTAFRTSRWFL